MADHENCVPASIGSGEKALISARIECLCRQMCVLERSHPATTCGISFAGTWFPWEESTTVTGSGVDHRTGDSLSQPVRSVEDAVSCQTAKTLPTTGLGKNPGGGQRMFVHWNRNIRDISRWIVETCQGSLHSSWSRVWPSHCTWGQSTVSIMSVQLSGGPTWHPVSGVLEVIWDLPEFVSTGHGLYRWWHVYSGSSGGHIASCGSRTSSPSSIAYTLCMQPLLRRS